MHHSVEKIAEIVARPEPDRRSVLQLGYNLGRLSERSGLGRERFWDPWKDAVDRWDMDELGRLAGLLVEESASWAADDRPEGAVDR